MSYNVVNCVRMKRKKEAAGVSAATGGQSSVSTQLSTDVLKQVLGDVRANSL